MLNDWMAKEDQYMDALLAFDDIGEEHLCGRCNQAQVHLFRCTECVRNVNYCQNCTILMHHGTPFHRVALWDRTTGCFRNTSLAEIGLVVSLGHVTPYTICPNPGSLVGVTAVHTNGIHNITVHFCNCSGAKSDDLQLFDRRLFSASVHSPQTAFTFAVLEQFQYHHLEGKGSAYIFMKALHRLTDDTGRMELEVSIFHAHPRPGH
jgi:hypothetical protein